MDIAYELGRYKKKVADQQKEIQELKQQVAGYQQAVDISYAMVTAAVRKVGSITVSQDELNEILADKSYACGSYDAETMAYTMEVIGCGEE